MKQKPLRNSHRNVSEEFYDDYKSINLDFQSRFFRGKFSTPEKVPAKMCTPSRCRPSLRKGISQRLRASGCEQKARNQGKVSCKAENLFLVC